MSNRRAIQILLAAVLAFVFFAARNLIRNGAEKKKNACIENLMAIEGMKEQYAIEHNGQAPIAFDVFVPDYLTAIPECPSGGEYTIGDMQNLVTCDAPGHRLPPE